MTAATDTLPPRTATAPASPAQNLITVRDLRIAFAQNREALEVVKGVSFRIPQGKTVALVGESGAGKSVIGQSIMGILPSSAAITGGEILFADPESDEVKDLAQIDPASKEYQAIRGGRISVIFQEPMTSLSAFHTIGDQISEALFLHRDVSRREGLDLVVEMLDLCGFPDPGEAVKRYPFELSGGLRQRAMIAMALVCDPALLIADEPTTALDVSVQAQILKLIKELQARLDMAVLIITHDLGVVANMADEVVVLFHGEVMESGTVKDIYRSPEHPYLNGLFGAVPHFDMKPGERLISPADLSPPADAQPAKKTPPAKREVKSSTLLDVRKLTKKFVTRKGGWLTSSGENTVVAVDDVSFEIRQRECLGLVGESGCGKTTLSKLIMRALSPTSGEILYHHNGNSIDLAQHRDHGGALNRAIQMVFQDPFGSLNPRMTVFDIIREPLVIHEIGERADHAAKVQELMRLVRLDPRFLNRYPHSFSRRAAPAHRAGARAGARSRPAYPRRAGLRARCVDSGANPEPAERHAGGTRPDLPVHLAQPGGGRLRRRPDHRHVPRPDRRIGAARGPVSQSRASLHAGADGGGSLRRLGPSARFRLADSRRRHEPGALAEPVHLPARGKNAVSRPRRPAPGSCYPRRDPHGASEMSALTALLTSVIGLLVLLVPAGAGELIEPPAFAERVAAGTLPPVAERVPDDAAVVTMEAHGKQPGRYGGTLKLLMGKQKDTRQLTVYAYARLVGYTPDFEIKPDILKHIDVADGRIFTLHLRRGHRWSDGHPFTAEDFRYYWEDMANNKKLKKGGPPKQMRVDGKPPLFEVVDEWTVRYSWEKPNPGFLPWLAGSRPPGIYRPAHYLKQFHVKYGDGEEIEKLIKKEGRRNWAELHFSRDRPLPGRQPGPANAGAVGQHHQAAVATLCLQAQPLLSPDRHPGPSTALYR